ncbi:MAG TPA: hypothetical protein VMG40_08985 [Bryobacteraceae bacterium]|nr:hypothetical protein [Bryobacteraceae bacterium]
MASEHNIHAQHAHTHGANCGHTAVRHDGHVDYLHDGHLHHVHNGRVEEHQISVSSRNPGGCTPGHDCGEHEKSHKHNAQCGHPTVPHGDHVDYLVAGHLHHQHGDHCDDHGALDLA